MILSFFYFGGALLLLDCGRAASSAGTAFR
jgi:hypothetical protein